ncbi:MAG: hypothetical protein WD069_11105 [Planctomycetales bacterium]
MASFDYIEWYTWFIDRPRDEIDPDGVVSSVADLLTRGRDTFRANADSLAQWSKERLPEFAKSASVVRAGWKIGIEAERSALAVEAWLAERLYPAGE